MDIKIIEAGLPIDEVADSRIPSADSDIVRIRGLHRPIVCRNEMRKLLQIQYVLKDNKTLLVQFVRGIAWQRCRS